MKGHTPVKPRYMPWAYCRYCGLIYLNNKATEKLIKKGCKDKE